MKNILFLLLFLLTFLNAKELEKIDLHLQWKHQFEFAGFYAAKEKGFYKDVNLDVNLIEYSEYKNIINEVINKDSSYGLCSSNLIAEYLKGKPLVILANLFKESPIAFITQKNISTPKDLLGKKVMTTALSSENSAMDNMFKSFGISSDDYIKIPPSFNIKDFVDKKVDGMIVYTTNETYTLDKLGIPYNIFIPSVYGTDFYDLNLFTHKKEIEENPFRAKKFKEATIKGWEYALKNKQEIIELILKKYNTQNKTYEALEYEANRIEQIMLTSLYKIGSIDEDRLKKTAENYIELGIVPKNTTLNFDNFIFEKNQSYITFDKNEEKFIKNHPSITLGVSNSFEPLFIKDEKRNLNGFIVELSQIIEKYSKIKINFEIGDWTDIIQKAKDRELDGLAISGYDEDRAKYFNYSIPYIKFHPLIIVNKNNPKRIFSIDDLKNKKVGIQKGSVVFTKLAKSLDNVKIEYYEYTESLIKALISHEIDFILLDETIFFNAKKIGLNNFIEHSFILGDEFDLVYSLRNDLPELTSIINKVLKSIKEEEINKIKAKWISETSISDEKINFSLEEKIYLERKEQINLCIDTDWYPFEKNDNGKHIGISADYFKIFQKSLTIPIKLINTSSWSESLEYTKNRKCDILPLAMPTPKRKEYLNFTSPYLKVPLVLATKLNIPYIDNLNILKDETIAVVKDYAYNEILRNKYSNFNIINVENTNEGLQKVANGEIFGFIGTLPTVGYRFQKDFIGELKISGKFDETWELGVAVRNDDMTLLNIFEKLVKSVPYDEKQKILNNYISLKYEKGTDYTLLYRLLFIFSIIFALTIYWNRKLKLKENELKKVNEELKRLSITDKLTNIYNRVKIDETILKEIKRSERTQDIFSVILVDIDFFKEVNDNFGHQTGDIVLIEFTKLLKKNIREIDMLGRWGGEEFLIVCPSLDRRDVYQTAERIRKEIESFDFTKVGKKTASFGLATYKQKDDLETIIKRADKALYEAKESGRNKVIIKN